MLLHCLPIATTRHLDWFISPQSAATAGGATAIQGSIYVFHVSFSSAGAFTTISMARDWAAR
jgi:hypothetical protein